MKLQLDQLLVGARHVLIVQDPFGNAIIATILGLTILGLSSAIVLLCRAARERLQIGRLARSETPHRPEVLRARFNRGLLGMRITLLDSSRRSGCPVQPAVLTAISKAQLEGGVLAHSLHHTSEILAPLGLLGTFVGLGMAIYEVAVLLAAVPRDGELHEVLGSLTVSMTQIEGATSGLSVAVATSIAGMVGTILISSAGRLVDAVHGKVLLQLEQLTQVHLLPAFSSDADVVTNRMLSTLENRTGDLADQIAGFNQSLAQGVVAVRDRIGEIVAETRVQGQRLAAVVGSLHDSVDSVATAFDEKVAGSSNAFTAAVHEAATDVRAATAHLRNTVKEVGETISEASTSFDRSVRVSASTFAGHVDRAGTGFRTNAEEGGAAIGAAASGVQATLTGAADSVAITLQTAERRLDESIEATRRSATIQRLAIDRHAEIAELYRGCTDELRQSLEKLTGVVEANDRRILDLNVDGRSFVDVMGEVAQVLVAREQNLQAAEILFNEWLVRVSGSLETIATQVRAAATADIQEARAELREAADSVRTMVDERATVARQLEASNTGSPLWSALLSAIGLRRE